VTAPRGERRRKPGRGGDGERELHDDGEGLAHVTEDEEEVRCGGNQHGKDEEPG
jgi:hypothetical protein